MRVIFLDSVVYEPTHTYTYDYENRLATASKTGMSATYTYDAFGRRTKKEVTVNSELSTVNYIYDGDQVIAETDSTGATLAKYIYGPGIDEPISMERGGQTYYYHFDGLGSVTDLTDSSGSTVETYTYDVYGQPNTTSTIDNPYMFTGRRYDAETGLHYYRARYYDPMPGRFLQTDPIEYYDSTNLYNYVSNNPINFIDPLGLYKYNFQYQLANTWDTFVQNIQEFFGFAPPEYAVYLTFLGHMTVTTIEPGKEKTVGFGPDPDKLFELEFSGDKPHLYVWPIYSPGDVKEEGGMFGIPILVTKDPKRVKEIRQNLEKEIEKEPDPIYSVVGEECISWAVRTILKKSDNRSTVGRERR